MPAAAVGICLAVWHGEKFEPRSKRVEQLWIRRHTGYRAMASAHPRQRLPSLGGSLGSSESALGAIRELNTICESALGFTDNNNIIFKQRQRYKIVLWMWWHNIQTTPKLQDLFVNGVDKNTISKQRQRYRIVLWILTITTKYSNNTNVTRLCCGCCDIMFKQHQRYKIYLWIVLIKTQHPNNTNVTGLFCEYW